MRHMETRLGSDRQRRGKAALQEGWVIANHILVSFHVAFISSVLALPAASILKWEVLEFIFVSTETLVSALFMYVSFHLGIALHELGHFITAARLNALNESVLPDVQRRMQRAFPIRFFYYLKLVLLIPYGKAAGVKREGLNYYPDAPYNLAVAAAGPRASRNVALSMLPPAIGLLAAGLVLDLEWAIYAGRLLLGVGVVSFLDFRLADPGKYRAFNERERLAQEKAKSVGEVSGWMEQAPKAKRTMLGTRMQQATHPRLGTVSAPWQFRNCGMGGRHTEKEYPESNVSMQEAMFLILGVDSYQEAQELTVRLQNRLKEIIEKEEGCRVMGIGLEGGLAPYIEKGSFPLPEVRLWSMMKQAIAECGCRPGVDVAIALDPAMSELEIAYREEFNVPDAVGTYLFWRDKSKTVLDRDGVLDVFVDAIQRYEIPLLSIEDGFSEHDHEGWRLLRERLGDRLFIIGDDLVTTNDKTIEEASDQGLINTALIKANQIGSLYETLLAMLVALGKGLELVVSHRSKSPNDDMEAQIALAANSLGLKAGGGANTERLVKYQSVSELLLRLDTSEESSGLRAGEVALVRKIRAYEEPTNAGIPTVGATAEIWLPSAGVALELRGATPLGTSAGSGEAIHLVDATIEYGEHKEIVDRYRAFFKEVEPGVFSFKKTVVEAELRAENEDDLTALYLRSRRYGGKGCLNAVDNVCQIIASAFEGKNAAELTLLELDRTLLNLELRTAKRRGKLTDDAGKDACIHVMQRKQNLGMNGMLSVSLALGRAIARVRGLQLYELLREEMLSIIDQLAAHTGVSITGSRFADYVTALREAAERTEKTGQPLYELLRELTGIYAEPGQPVARRREAEQAPARPEAPRSPEREPEPAPVQQPAVADAVLEQLANRLGDRYRNDVHHGLHHARDLLAHARRLASELAVGEELDWQVLGAAIGLHDVAAAQPSHGREGAERAQQLLPELPGFSQRAVKRVADAIVLHEDKTQDGVQRRKRAGLEAQLLYDADQLDAFGPKGVYRYVAAYTLRNTPLARIRDDARRRFETLSFDATRELAADSYGYTAEFTERLGREGAAENDTVGAAGIVHFIREHVGEHPAKIADRALSALSSRQNGEGEDGAARYAIEYFRALRSAYGAGAPAQAPEPEAASETGPAPELADAEQALLADLDAELHAALCGTSEPDLSRALHGYLERKSRLGSRERPFGIVNNRVFRADGSLVVPYLFGPSLEVHRVGRDQPTEIVRRRLPPGTIYTDALILGLAEASGEATDLETPLYVFDPEQTPLPQITRIRDAALLLEKVNDTTNRNQAVFWLRWLAARLCNMSVKDMLGAKNLQPEIRDLTKQLTRFLNSPLRRRLLVLSRLIVRNLSSLVGKPNVIDRLWNDTIDLAEIHIQGSAIVNELRRTSHHALGRRTLQIAEAYLGYLQTGDTKALARLGFGAPSQADVAARSRPGNLEILERVIEDLRRLLGTAQIVARVQEWRELYAEALMRCEFGSSIDDELAAVLDKGIKEKNRWVYYHHLRILSDKHASFRSPPGIGAQLRAALEAAKQKKPDTPDFDADQTSRELEAGVRSFVKELRAAHQDELFVALDDLMKTHQAQRFFEVFEKTRALRKQLVALIERGAFDDQRYYLSQLEGLIEEMGYLALRQIASHYQENGVDIEQCLDIIRLAALNLRYAGLFSQELNDFAAMLADRGRSEEELLNVLQYVERVYHKVRQRVTVPYEKMQARLGLEPNELRLILANMQRTMHDLNSMVHFADTAAHYIRDQLDKGERIRRSARPTAQQNGHVVHISHRAAIAQLVDSGEISLRERYGGKGGGLLYISYLNLPTRDGFVLPADYARAAVHKKQPERLRAELASHLELLERDVGERQGLGRQFASGDKPLLLAVRGGSVFSMPGILSTVVFVGMNDEIAEKLAKDGPWRAYDSYRRFLASYAAAVWDVDLETHSLVDKAKQHHGVRFKQELPWQAMKEIATDSKRVLRELGFGEKLDAILADPFSQVVGAVHAVLDSWSSETARRFRDLKGICHSWNTGVVVQEMAFGNGKNDAIEPGMDETEASLTGVITRTYPTSAGVRAFEGEVKFSAAGDDLVGGTTFSGSFRPIQDLEQLMPMLETRLKHAVAKLRRFMGTDQEVEFTVERGVLSILQTRRAEAHFDDATERFLEPGEPATRGLGVRGGGFRGFAAFDDADLAELGAVDVRERDDVDGVLLVIENPIPDDIPTIISAGGLLTARGGSTSHAAVAINGIEDRDYAGVVSAMNFEVHADRHEALIKSETGEVLHRIKKGDIVSIHGTTGEVYVGSRRRQIVTPPAPALRANRVDDFNQPLDPHEKQP
jgi:enolase/HD superfamily phosphodiesterase